MNGGFLADNGGLLILAITAALALLAAGWYFRREYLANRHAWKVQRVIEGLGVENLRDAVLPDGVDGLAFIDWLLLTPKGLVLLDVHHREGLLFGGKAVDQWTQVIGGRSYKFPNPLYSHDLHRQALAWQAQEMPVQGLVVFSSAGKFLKGVPEGCVTIDALPGALAPLLEGEVPAPLRAAWEALRQLSVSTRATLGPRLH